MRLGKRLNSFVDLAPHDHLEGVGATVADPVFCSREEASFITGLCLGLTFSLWGHNGLSLLMSKTPVQRQRFCVNVDGGLKEGWENGGTEITEEAFLAVAEACRAII